MSANTNVGKKSFLLRFLIVCFCAYMLFSIGSLLSELSSDREALAQIQTDIEETVLRIEEKDNLLKTSTREELIERAARESLGYVYPNEQVFVDIN